MLSRWTKKDPSSTSGAASSSAPNGSAAEGPAAAGLDRPAEKERIGTDGLTASERRILDGMERYYGMENFGNTCYANSVVQALFFCRPFRDCVNTYPSLLTPYSPHDRPPSAPGLNLHIPEASSSGTSSMVSSTLLVPPGSAAVPPLQSPGATRTSRWPGSKRVSSSGNTKGDAAVHDYASQSLEPPVADQTRSRSPSRTRTSLQQPTHPPPANLFAALQSLFRHISSIPPPTYTISQNKDKDGNPPTPVPAVTKVIAPAAFIAKLKMENVMFQGTMQQDAHEFLNFLLNKIGEDLAAEDREQRAALKAAYAAQSLSADGLSTSTSSLSALPAELTGKPEPTFVQKLFEGTLVNETRCLTCETTSSRDESFLDLSIDIEQNTSVTACLRQFSASETLCQRNKFYCDTCCGLQEAEKRMKVKTLPNVLALHLKRFKYQEDLGRYIKLSYRVVFPFHLRLPNTSEHTDNPDRLYELFAFVVHIGGGPHHGHYIVIVKTAAGWMMFDDVNVSPVDEADIQRYFGESTSGSGYVLFYQAVDLDPTSLGLRPRAPAGDAYYAASAPSSASSRPSPPDSLNLSQFALDSPQQTAVSHQQAVSPPTLAPEVSTPSPPPTTPPPPSEVGEAVADLPSPLPPHSLPREQFASAPASVPTPERARHQDANLLLGRAPARPTRTPSQSRHASSTSTTAADSPAVPTTTTPSDTETKARRRFSSMGGMAASSTNPAAPPSSNSAYLQTLSNSGKAKGETKEERKAREAAEKERERLQKEQLKLGRAREKEREKAEKARRDEEKAEAARLAKSGKEAEKRQSLIRKASMVASTPTEASTARNPMARIGSGLGRSSSMAFKAFSRKSDKDTS